MLKYYKQTAIIFLNTLIFLLLLNFILAVFYSYKEKNQANYDNQITQKYGKEAVTKAYPHLSYSQINQLLTETWNRPLAYNYYTTFKEKPFKGTYVNIHSAGFRFIKDQSAWPIDTSKYNIFVFGGSTTFGYGVADQETIPSYLQNLLNKNSRTKKQIAVYNFGTAFYYSVQEKLFFEKLIYQNQVPDLAIFIDGLNDVGVFAEPSYATEMRNLYEGKPGFFLQKWVKQIPLMRLVYAIQGRILKNTEANIPDFCAPSHLERCYNRYIQTKSMIEAVASQKRINTLFVWQPSSRYLYFPKEDLFGVRNAYNPNSRDCAYTYFFKNLKELEAQGNFIWLADMQKNKKQNLYVDKVHYSNKLNFIIADTLATYLSQNLL
ncbi:SGNH/GDSL hydrolase family protein [Adhaeribacter rhizoryzae]|uniref:SGNH/GDSL hydrolase family protein n=1 Tax=Adhaeribacter rhizoryzae TaxID=2607907 RepID=A0A5M6D5P1_9BACT|nr:SGNH/GDSL hydrolase family protein [Adhaeribacter rhizoryzae]KAA5542828.1 SGNH/GDSL hydrolase family protein [Adhaeribacter rhizoryzae]